MSLTQKTYVDYKNLGDTGIDGTDAIQPISDGEPAGQAVFRRPSENLRTRTEIARSVISDLLYYRDRSRYVLQLATTGVFSWAGTVANGGTGILNNTTQLTVLPFLSTTANIAGYRTVGTNGTNAITYGTTASGYASDGLNQITITHQSVPGTVTPTCTITAGPIKRIVVTFDSANTAHDAPSITTIVNAAITADSTLTGKFLATNAGVAANAILAIAEFSFDTRVNPAGVTGRMVWDAEAHTLASNALQTFTTGRPLVEGDTLAIRYDWVVEPAGSSNDPKGGIPGGRAESNVARGNADVSTNLFVCDDNTPWIPGAIPLCKVVNNTLRFLDGTVITAGGTGAPGTALGSYISSAAFSGTPTLVVNGGIDNTAATKDAQTALASVDQRLGQSRYATYTVTDGSASSGGHYNAATGLASAMTALGGTGGKLFVRRGTYTGPTVNTDVTYARIEGETYGNTNVNFGTTVTLTGDVEFRNLLMGRTGNFTVTTSADTLFEHATLPAGLFTIGNSSTAVARLHKVNVIKPAVATTNTYGILVNTGSISARNCAFLGPDSGVTSGGAAVRHGANVARGFYENCSFGTANDNQLLDFGTGPTGTLTFKACSFTGGSTAAYTLDIPATVTGGGDIIFDGCVFTNSNANPLIRLQHVAGRVIFRDCTFNQSSNTVVTSGAFQQAFTIAPGATGGVPAQAIFEDCRISISQLNAGGNTMPTYEFGGVNSTTVAAPSAGVTVIDGLHITLLTAVTNLPAFTPFAFLANSGATGAQNVFNNIRIDFNGKRFQTAGSANTLGLGATPGYFVQFYGNFLSNSFKRTLTRANNITFTGLDNPTTASAVCGWVDVYDFRINELVCETVATLAAVSSAWMNYNIHGDSIVTTAHLEVGDTTSTYASIHVAGANSNGRRAELVDSFVSCSKATPSVYRIFYLDRGTLRGVRTSKVYGTDAGVYMLPYSELIGCNLDLVGGTFVTGAVYLAGIRCHVSDNVIVAQANPVVLPATTPDACVITSNIFHSNTVAAATLPTAGGTTILANNLAVNTPATLTY